MKTISAIVMCLSVSASLAAAAEAPNRRERPSEVWTKEQEKEAGIVYNSYVSGNQPFEALSSEALPKAFTWCDKDGVNYCTMSRNQHIPQVSVFV